MRRSLYLREFLLYNCNRLKKSKNNKMKIKVISLVKITLNNTSLTINSLTKIMKYLKARFMKKNRSLTNGIWKNSQINKLICLAFLQLKTLREYL